LSSAPLTLARAAPATRRSTLKTSARKDDRHSSLSQGDQPLLIRDRSKPAERRDPTGLRPFEILRERFARGEIDRAEYEEKRRVISQG
jgi:hypothetical protein